MDGAGCRQPAEIFETAVTVFPVATGTACNALALSALTPPWGAVMCHERAYRGRRVRRARILHRRRQADDAAGRGRPDRPATLEQALAGAGFGVVHSVQPSALSLTQATECGTVYRPDAIRALADPAHARGMGVHMDGARFANAVVSLGASPAELTGAPASTC